MLPFGKILCPTDFSDPSYKGVEAANELAEHFSAKLILMNVITPLYPIGAPGVPSSYQLEETYQEMGRQASTLLKEIEQKRISKQVSTETIVAPGNAPDEIVRRAGIEKVDLIVIATHGWTGWRKLVYGSVADKVVRLSPCPVLTISEHGGQS